MSTIWKPSRPVTYDWPWLSRELDSLKKGLEDAAPYLTLQFQTAEPARTFAGMIVLANQVYWDPGNGSGLYRRNAGNNAWIKVLDDSDIGTIATQNENAVAITGGTISGLTSLGVTGTATVGSVLVNSSSGLVGYTTGAGGTVTQATDKTTAVTLNAPSGIITTSNSALAAGATATFTMNNTSILNAATGITAYQDNAAGWGNYRIEARSSAVGTALIRITNITAGSLSQAIGIRFWLTRTSNS